MAILTTGVTYGGKTPTGDLRSNLIFKPIINLPSLQALGYDIREDIQSSEQMYQIIPSDKVTKKKTTCGWNPAGTIANLIDKTINVVKLSVEMEQCGMDFDGKILQLVKKRGYDRENLTDTEFAQILQDVAIPVISRDMQRIIALGDTANASADYNQLDGKWKKIFAMVAGNAALKTADMPDTTGNVLAAGAAKTALDSVHFNAPIELQSFDPAQTVKVVTRSVYNNYLQTLANNNNLESSWSVLQNGVKTLTHFGVPVVPEDIVDTYLAADFAAEVGGNKPHRIYWTAVNNITVGTDLESDFSYVDFWYEKKEQLNLMRAEYKLGVSLGWESLFSVAY